MPAIPAQCPNPKCQAIFPSGVAITNSQTVTLRNNKSQCPLCGAMSPMAEGVFNISQETIEVVVGSKFTRDMIMAFADVVGGAAAGSVPKDEAVRQADRIDPRFGKLLGRSLKFGLPAAALLAAVLQLYVAHLDAAEQHLDSARLLAVSEEILNRIAAMRFDPQAGKPKHLSLPGLGGPPYRPKKSSGDR